MSCGNCGQANVQNAKFCKRCRADFSISLITCSNGHRYDASLENCPYCPEITSETILDTITLDKTMTFCKNCGHGILINSKFCNQCGSYIKDEVNVEVNPYVLAMSARSTIITINDKEVGKIVSSNSKMELEIEAQKLKYANKINDLLIQYIDLRTDASGNNILVMERIYPLEYRALSLQQKNGIIRTIRNQA